MSRHLDNAVMRRYVDEPDALLSYEKAHLLECLRCRQALQNLRENATAASQILALDSSAANPGSVRAAILERAATVGEASAIDERVRRAGTSWRWFAAVAAAVVIAIISYAPFRAYAEDILTIFQPRDLAPISMTRADVTRMRDVPKLDQLGTLHVKGEREARHFSSLAAVKAFAHEPVLHPAYLPSQLAHTSDYEATPPQAVRFTFDMRKAEANAARNHQKLPAPPAGVDGSVLTMRVQPFVVQSYGMKLAAERAAKHSGDHAFAHNAILVVQGRVPEVRSNGVRTNEILSYLLSLPNVPDDVKTQIRAIQNPQETIPVPVSADRTSARNVTVRGARALLIGDNTGVGSVVIWLENGVFYSVSGGFTADEITKVANSMTL